MEQNVFMSHNEINKMKTGKVLAMPFQQTCTFLDKEKKIKQLGSNIKSFILGHKINS